MGAAAENDSKSLGPDMPLTDRLEEELGEVMAEPCFQQEHISAIQVAVSPLKSAWRWEWGRTMSFIQEQVFPELNMFCR